VLLEHVAGSEDLDPLVLSFFEDEGIDLVRIGEEGLAASAIAPKSYSSVPLSEDCISRAMAEVVNADRFPLLVMDLYGKHRTGVVVACLRKLQRWSLSAVWHLCSP